MSGDAPAAAPRLGRAPAPAEVSAYREEGTFELCLRTGEQFVVPRFCPHRGGRLDHGEVGERKATLVCPLHRSVFELRSGEQLAGPPCGRLAVERR